VEEQNRSEKEVSEFKTENEELRLKITQLRSQIDSETKEKHEKDISLAK